VDAAPEDHTRSRGIDYDLLIIGSGSAGVAAAIRASELGATAAVVEQAEVIGGTCVNIGCIPSKNLIEAAHHFHAARTGFPGIAASEPQLAWGEVLAQKRRLVEALRREKYTDVLQAYEGITLLRGQAELRPDKHDDEVVVRVNDRDLRARRVILAAGTRPAMLPIPGLADVGALDSTSAMELDRLPESMLVIGAGSVGLELGQAFQRFGVRVVVVEALDRILPTESSEVSAVLQDALAAEGMEFHVATRVTRAERTSTGVRLEVTQGSLLGYLEAEQLLVAAGRVPNVEQLGVEAARVRTDARGYVTTDEYMRTSNPHIFAAGDVTGGPAYVYVAALEGGIAAQTALSDIVGAEPLAADLGTVPRVTFTDPQVAAVGFTAPAARAAGHVVEETTLPVEYLPRAAVSYRRRGMITLVAESGTGRLLGAQVISPNAGDVIGEAVLAVRFGLTTRDLVSTLHAYLTWSEGLKLAAQTFTKDVAKLSCCA
jgi:mercuric reductase